MAQHRAQRRRAPTSRIAGLEIGPRVLRVAERTASGAIRTGEVVVGSSVLDDGRVADPAALAVAIRELWQLAGISSRQVVVGLSNQDVVSRQLEMPELGDADLASALRFELADLVPFPISDAVVRFRRIGPVEDATAPTTRVLAVAALGASVREVLDAVRAAGLRPRSVDHAPMALVRAIGSVLPTDETEAVVSVAADGFTVAIHEGGSVHFTRAIATQAGASAPSDLEAELVFIEEYRRRVAGQHDGTPVAAQRLGPVVEAIRGTLEYSASQPGARPIGRVTVCGDELLVPTARQLAQVLPCPVAMADPIALSTATDTAGGVHGGETSRYAAALGLTLGGDDGPSGPTPLDLVPESITSPGRTLAARGAVAAAVTAVLLGGVSTTLGPDDDSTAAAAAAAEHRATAVAREVSARRDDLDAANELRRRRQQERSLERLAVDWGRIIAAVRAGAPAGTTIVSISGDAPTLARSGRRVDGTIEIVASATSNAAISDWMLTIESIDGLSDPWLDSASGGSTRDGGETTFTLTAVVSRPTEEPR